MLIIIFYDLKKLLVALIKLLPQELFLLFSWFKVVKGIQKYLLDDLVSKIFEIHKQLIEIVLIVDSLPNNVVIVLILSLLLEQVSLLRRKGLFPAPHE